MRQPSQEAREKLSFTVNADTYAEFVKHCDHAYISREKYLAAELVSFADRHKQQGLSCEKRDKQTVELIKLLEAQVGETTATPTKDVRINLSSWQSSHLKTFFKETGVDRNLYIQSALEQLNERLKVAKEILWGNQDIYNGDGGGEDNEEDYFMYAFAGHSKDEYKQMMKLIERLGAKLEKESSENTAKEDK
jgi:hypothetical protein